MTVRTFFAAAAAVIVGLSAAAAGAEELRVAATPVPHADILKLIEPDLKKDGYDLKIVEFSDYVSRTSRLMQAKWTPTTTSTSPFWMPLSSTAV